MRETRLRNILRKLQPLDEDPVTRTNYLGYCVVLAYRITATLPGRLTNHHTGLFATASSKRRTVRLVYTARAGFERLLEEVFIETLIISALGIAGRCK
ncbi:hypothetical protein R1flu_009625 [Riccia fluitans]|uniref:Uncharacterized protein n=1 Tax=Riccia fluitans TaxID=41844 RepID=A0ABD1Z2S1_9MARC